MNKIKLEVGKKYRNRKGEVVEIARQLNNNVYDFCCKGGSTYRENGNFFSWDEESSNDLIEEVIEPAQEPVRSSIKWAKEAHAYIDGIEVEGKSSEDTDWYPAQKGFNPVSDPHFEWRIAVHQWRKDLAEKMKAGGILEYWNGAANDWRRSGYGANKILCSDYMKSAHESSYRIKPEPKPDVVRFYSFGSYFEVRKADPAFDRAELKLI